MELEQNYRAMLEAKEKEIERLRQSLQAAEKQLKIQTQVQYLQDTVPTRYSTYKISTYKIQYPGTLVQRQKMLYVKFKELVLRRF